MSHWRYSFSLPRDLAISWVKIAVGHRIFPTEFIKSPISYVDKFCKMSDSKKKKKKEKKKKKSR